MVTLKDIFNVWYGVNLEVVNSNVVEKGIPFVSRQSVNNGVVCHVEPIEGVEPNPAHTLSIAVSGSVLSTFYHDYKYYSGRDVYVAEPKEPMTKEEMLFYAYVIEQNKFRYNYGRGANRTFRDIVVPARDEVPLYIKEYPADPQFINASISPENLSLNTAQWEWFRYSDLFKVKGSKTTPLLELESNGQGLYPYVTTQAVNNGVEGYYNYFTEKGGVLTVDSAVLGFCTYQEKDFSASDHVEVLMPLFKMNQYIALFLTTLINMEQYRYSYGRKCSQRNLKKAKIKLPVTPQGMPDWQFMEDYIKSLPYSKNLEPVDTEKLMGELLKYKKRNKSLEHQLATHHQSDVHYHINANNVNLQTDGTINIGEINEK